MLLPIASGDCSASAASAAAEHQKGGRREPGIRPIAPRFARWLPSGRRSSRAGSRRAAPGRSGRWISSAAALNARGVVGALTPEHVAHGLGSRGHRFHRPPAASRSSRSRRRNRHHADAGDDQPPAKAGESLHWISDPAGQLLEDRAIRPLVAVAMMDKVLQRLLQTHQLGDLAVDLGELGLGDRLDVGALARLVAVERQQLAAFLDREAEAPARAAGSAAGECPRSNSRDSRCRRAPASGAGCPRSSGWSSAEGRSVRMRRRYSSLPRHSFSALSRSALAITDTDDRLIAAAASIGDSSMPNTG